MATETSSLLDSQSDYQETVKCIVQCKQLFGEGVSHGAGGFAVVQALQPRAGHGGEQRITGPCASLAGRAPR